MFTATDRWQAFVDTGWKAAQVETGPRDEATCKAVLYARNLGDVTVAEAIAKAVGDPASRDLLRWIGLFMLGDLPQEQRTALIAAVGKLDPADAAAIYCWRPDLTDTEDAALRDAFMPAMPVMRRKVESGTLVRAKDRG